MYNHSTQTIVVLIRFTLSQFTGGGGDVTAEGGGNCCSSCGGIGNDSIVICTPNSKDSYRIMCREKSWVQAVLPPASAFEFESAEDIPGGKALPLKLRFVGFVFDICYAYYHSTIPLVVRSRVCGHRGAMPCLEGLFTPYCDIILSVQPALPLP